MQQGWRRPHLFVCLLLAVLSCGARADGDAIDAYMRAEMDKRRIPGAALVVIQHGKVSKMQGYGLAHLEHDVPVTPDTVFELASLTKQFTAAGIMLLVQEGKLALDDPIGGHLPATPEAWSGITVRHLLTHTGGFPGLGQGFRSLSAGGAKINYTTTEMFLAATHDALGYAPGTRYQYSDVGYFLLGMILEKASGERYRAFMTERFFKPLGMTATSVLDQLAVVKNRAAGYTLRKGQVVNIRRVAQVELPSHYGIFSTVRDLAKWEVALATGKVVTAASLEQMWTPVRLNDGTTHGYGFGWVLSQRRGHRVISHTGITGTQYSRFPEYGLTVIVLTNLGRWLSGGDEVNPFGLTVGVAGHYSRDL